MTAAMTEPLLNMFQMAGCYSTPSCHLARDPGCSSASRRNIPHSPKRGVVGRETGGGTDSTTPRLRPSAISGDATENAIEAGRLQRARLLGCGLDRTLLSHRQHDNRMRHTSPLQFIRAPPPGHSPRIRLRVGSQPIPRGPNTNGYVWMTSRTLRCFCHPHHTCTIYNRTVAN